MEDFDCLLSLQGGVCSLCDGPFSETCKAHVFFDHDPVKAWVEALISKLIQPPVTSCQAKFIRVANHHAPDRGVLVVHIPLSSHRPHYVRGTPDVPHIRAGEHSGPMSLQTFLDISSRGEAPQAVIESLGYQGGPLTSVPQLVYLDPRVKLLTGPVCKEWAFELHLPSGLVQFLPMEGTNIYVQGGTVVLTLEGHQPLFPGRPTPVASDRIGFQLQTTMIKGSTVTAKLYAGASQPVERAFSLEEVFTEPDRFR